MADLGRKLAAAFEQIHQERMLGLPILHPGLRVAVVGGRDWQNDWLGILLTPWCMNLVLIPGPDSEQQLGPVGSTGCIDLPAGRFELIASEEGGVGRFAACSLFSPMQDFVDQASALETAELIMTELFEPKGLAGNDLPELGAELPAQSQRKHQEQTVLRDAAQESAQQSTELADQPVAQTPVQQRRFEPRPAISRRDLLRGRLRP